MNKADLTHHISRVFDEELGELHNNALTMGGLVEQQVRLAMKALVKGDRELARQVAGDDYKINRMEVGIDEECSRILALRQPAASDLRLVVAIIKTITDLERIGDEAEKIGYLASRLAKLQRPENKYSELKHLGRQIRQMLHSTLDAFARFDAEAALAVAKTDDSIDEEYEAISRQSITLMMEDPRTIRQVLDTLWVARSLERIGDHARNICEYVVYMVQGKDVRHLHQMTESEDGPPPGR